MQEHQVADMARTTYRLPTLHRIGLKGFSLYTEKVEIDLEISCGVTCLMGANGIGKSTFIAAVNFGLCGRLPEPGETFQSSNEYFGSVRSFSESFFDGRITELDRSRAEIELEFSIGEDRYHIIRGAFATDDLRYATRNDKPLTGTSESNLGGHYELYKSAVAESVGVSTFEQFVFLQLFIFTFDERRHLTFWEPDVQRQMLLLCFGEDVQEVQEAENLRRKIERLESNARNANYQAKEFQKRLQNSLRILQAQEPDTLDLHAKREELDRYLDALIDEEANCRDTLSDSKLRAADLRAQSLRLKEHIDSVFIRQLARSADLRIRPVVANSLATGLCQLCGAVGETVIQGINSRISQSECPLCGEDLPGEAVPDGTLQELVQLDRQLTTLNEAIQGELGKQQRIQTDVDKIQKSIDAQKKEIAAFDHEHRHLSQSIGTTDVAEVNNLIDSSQKAIRELEGVKVKARRRRDEAQVRLREIQSRISLQYEQSEQDFLRTFKDLAESFIGLDLDVRFDSRSNDMRLVLDMEGQSRRQHYQLSESQRFFVDIALRMAITSFVSASGTGTLLVDTPEGSLDIAYESRAGRMFAQFVARGCHLLMTANINTSQLLRELAKQCSPENMHIERMTEWTILSEVQIEAQELFQQAYDEIDRELMQAPLPG